MPTVGGVQIECFPLVCNGAIPSKSTTYGSIKCDMAFCRASAWTISCHSHCAELQPPPNQADRTPGRLATFRIRQRRTNPIDARSDTRFICIKILYFYTYLR
jgi:hypothetical protein